METPTTDIPPIEEMPNLSERLGKSRIERIRYAGKHNAEKQRRSRNIKNTVKNQMQFCRPNALHCNVNDIITGAANFDDDQSRPLNINRLYHILQMMEVINTREIVKMTGLEERQAQKYVRAIKFALPYLEKHFESVTDFADFATPIAS